ncbi:RcnB family protein [Sphingomonas sp. CBMAI 2297]|uniref:RcnB family protein n=1 Tax=Sphingomonas sp. CBMAI 2297 TaxID=2991720 RepID=UPI00245507F4|nr:RcnB family protein [Sphingomonas sp. CBMAI 2297]MDH4745331.1 RcnB family protein [Sphingomonas sp. CBMAI 2297]
MRHLLKPALMASALLAALPAVAQVAAPGPAWGGSGGPIPAPGGAYGGRGVPMPPPPRVPGPPPVVQNGPGVPTAGARVWQNGRWMALPPRGHGQVTRPNGNRWGGMIGGRWYAGAQAPGGWNGYRRLGRGNHLPGYWMGGGFRIPDYLSWGLAAPPYGYFWVRYYDDAVLVDDRGDVWDSVSGIGWADADSWADSSGSYSSAYSRSGTGAGYREPIRPIDPNDYYDGYPGDYAPPADAPPPPGVQVQGYYGSGGAYYGGGSHQSGAYYYGAPMGSTVIVTMPAVTTTTTVTEEVVERTTYVRAAPRRVVRKAPVRRYKPRVQCCVCGCR